MNEYKGRVSRIADNTEYTTDLGDTEITQHTLVLCSHVEDIAAEYLRDAYTTCGEDQDSVDILSVPQLTAGIRYLDMWAYTTNTELYLWCDPIAFDLERIMHVVAKELGHEADDTENLHRLPSFACDYDAPTETIKKEMRSDLYSCVARRLLSWLPHIKQFFGCCDG